MSSSYKNRIQEFKATLSEQKIDLKALRELCFSDVFTVSRVSQGSRVKEAFVRSAGRSVSDLSSSAILLNYLPPDQALWETFLTKQRDVYAQFLREMIIQPGIAKANLGVSREDVTLEDHPLNPNPDSRWNTYFKDNEVLLQIDKDVRRLYPDMAFFQRPTDFPCQLILDPQNEYETLRRRVEQTTLKAQTVNRNRSGVTNVSSPGKALNLYPSNEYEVLPNGCEAHWEVVERILFIYAKLNPGIAYVQGMNEIVGPIYYTFATDPNSQWKEHAEADTFFCFTNLMSENRDNFIKSLDDSQCGITFKMESVFSKLKEKDTELYMRLQEQNIKPQYFTFRWLTLLLSQEIIPSLMFTPSSSKRKNCRTVCSSHAPLGSASSLMIDSSAAHLARVGSSVCLCVIERLVLPSLRIFLIARHLKSLQTADECVDSFRDRETLFDSGKRISPEAARHYGRVTDLRSALPASAQSLSFIC
ncbi:TBC1 domain family member 13 [Labeo rohita]|uniref:TBC1 domain family member 13 n=1 Tax=Labeo rohita TaxID=84645 RepID=A0ABQ8KZY9_LABRO|nr:TBC1 domain family member 13 [Labeo rohita]